MKEEEGFLRTLETGIRLLEKICPNRRWGVERRSGFPALDTFGFPLDLTELILREHGMTST
jgi:alanyl-tRNA synthetase